MKCDCENSHSPIPRKCFYLTNAVIYIYAYFFHLIRRKGEPEIVKGHFIWGSCIDFNTHAVNFLHKATKAYGSVFTMRLFNQYITIVNDPHCYEAIHKEKNFDFDPIQKQVNWNVFSFVLKEPRKMIKDTGRTVSGAKLGKSMVSFTAKLNYSYDKMAMKAQNGKEWTRQGLKSFTSETMFDALFNTIFGNSDSHFFNSANTAKNFEIFHRYFNYFWLGVPKAFFPDAMKALGEMVQQPSSDELLARPDLSEYIRTATNYMKEKGQTESDIMGHSLVYLHVNYNTSRLAFWVLSNILEHTKAREALMEELHQAIAEKQAASDDDEQVTFSAKEVESLPVLGKFRNLFIVTYYIMIAGGSLLLQY